MSKTALAREFGIQFTNPERKSPPRQKVHPPPTHRENKGLTAVTKRSTHMRSFTALLCLYIYFVLPVPLWATQKPKVTIPDTTCAGEIVALSSGVHSQYKIAKIEFSSNSYRLVYQSPYVIQRRFRRVQCRACIAGMALLYKVIADVIDRGQSINELLSHHWIIEPHFIVNRRSVRFQRERDNWFAERNIAPRKTRPPEHFDTYSIYAERTPDILNLEFQRRWLTNGYWMRKFEIGDNETRPNSLQGQQVSSASNSYGIAHLHNLQQGNSGVDD